MIKPKFRIQKTFLKRTVLSGLLFFSPVAPMVLAQDSADSLKTPLNTFTPILEISAMGGLALSFGGVYYNSDDLGFGGAVRGIYMIQSNLGIGLSVDYRRFTGSYSYLNQNVYPTVNQQVTYTQDWVEFIGTEKISLEDTRSINPYLLFGTGFALVSVVSESPTPGFFYYPNQFYIFPLVQCGFGMDFPFRKNWSFFVEADENISLSTNYNNYSNYNYFSNFLINFSLINAGVVFRI